jgi:hypothetical protein
MRSINQPTEAAAFILGARGLDEAYMKEDSEQQVG